MIGFIRQYRRRTIGMAKPIALEQDPNAIYPWLRSVERRSPGRTRSARRWTSLPAQAMLG
ncbi:hypothetical protein CHELA1G11_21785 [Hyphomicrobiales bacterium]|nr:hypothetical protein CHELA1G11_21785 [Hyphomicrobiales bacterium]